MDWSSLLPLGAIALMCFLMMRYGGCCGGGHSPSQGNPQKPSSKGDAPIERNPTTRP